MSQKLFCCAGVVLAVVLFVSADARAQAQDHRPDWIGSITEPAEGLAIADVSRQTGLATFASSPGRGILLQVDPGASPETRAKNFVQVYGRQFGLATAADVRLVRSEVDDLGIEHVRLQQVHGGVPVTAGDFLVHMRGSRVVAANGHVIEDLPSDLLPRVPQEIAKTAARRWVAKYKSLQSNTALYSEPRLEILNRALLAGYGTDRSRLAWFVEASGEALRQFIWVDAHTGAILLTFSQLAEAKYRTVYTANSTSTLPGVLVRTEGGAATGDADNDNAYTYAGITYDYFKNNHNRDSYDNAGAELKSTTHYCADGTCPDYANAFWNGTQMVYGNGYASADDVVGHELTHAVTGRTAGLFYYQQSGALNESFSDIFGETIDLLSSTGGGNDTAAARWSMGEDLSIGAIRNMMNPNLYENPAKMTDSLYFVCSTTGYNDGATDRGGVHTNSGVPNHAYALMVDGGFYNGKSITAIGTTKAAKIEYRALTTYLTSGSSFIDDYNALNRSCTELIGTVGITASDCTQVKNALDAVEMNLPWGCPGATADPPLCPSGKPLYAFFDGFETGAPNWYGQSAGAGGWMNDTGVAKTGQGMAYGNDPDSASIHSMVMVTPVLVPAGGRMYFDHLFEFENDYSANYDGGRFEYSINGGTTWVDANSLIDAGHAYDGTLDGGNMLGAVPAFVGASYGYNGTRLNLAGLAGQSIIFRFKIGTDAFVGSLGWMLDNVGIYSCVASIPFTDDPLIAGTTLIKAVHVTELRGRINAIRAAKGLLQVVWTNAITPSSTKVRAVDITEMRTALAAAYAAAGLPAPTYTDALTTPTPVRALHIAELRAAVIALE